MNYINPNQKKETKIGQIYGSVGAIQWNYPRRLNMCLESQVPNSTKINRLNPACIANSNPMRHTTKLIINSHASEYWRSEAAFITLVSRRHFSS